MRFSLKDRIKWKKSYQKLHRKFITTEIENTLDRMITDEERLTQKAAEKQEQGNL